MDDFYKIIDRQYADHYKALGEMKRISENRSHLRLKILIVLITIVFVAEIWLS